MIMERRAIQTHEERSMYVRYYKQECLCQHFLVMSPMTRDFQKHNRHVYMFRGKLKVKLTFLEVWQQSWLLCRSSDKERGDGGGGHVCFDICKYMIYVIEELLPFWKVHLSVVQL